MFKNYLVLAYRNLLKRKLYAFVTIGGLAIGVAVCLMILQYVGFELSYDTFHKNSSSIFRTVSTYYIKGELRGTYPLSDFAQGPSLLSDIPEIKAYARTHFMHGGGIVSNENTLHEPIQFHEANIQFADSSFFRIFTFTAIEGNLLTSLDHPKSIVVTQSAADKYFGKNKDVIGKILNISGSWWVNGDYQVTAVVEDVPQNSHLTFDFVVSMYDLLQIPFYRNSHGWGTEGNFVTYVEFAPSVDMELVTRKLPSFIEKYQGSELAKSNSHGVLTFQPLEDIHLSPGLDLESSPTIGMDTIYFFILISLFIISIAWINYINLSTARAMERAREVGVKKAIGAHRSQLIVQFIFESLLVNFVSIILALFLAILLLPILGEIVGKDLLISLSDAKLWIVLLLLFFVGTIVSGAYPSLVLSSFKTTVVIKGGSQNVGGFSLRKVLVIFQFASSLILIIGTFTISRQILFMVNKDKGFNMEQMLIVNGPGVADEKSIEVNLLSFKNNLSQIPSVNGVTTSDAIPGGGYSWGTGIRKSGAAAEENKSGSVVWVDPDFINVYGMSLLSGRKWNRDIASDMRSVLINEAAVKNFELGDVENAITQKLVLGKDTLAVLGVIKNYHWNSLKSEHVPFILSAKTVSRKIFSIRINDVNMNESINEIKKQYKTAFPGNPFEFHFLDDFYNQQYKDEQQFHEVFKLFTILAIIIACLGLWGLASFTTAQRLKEISIRKVLGATSGNIVSLLSMQFLKLVFIAGVIALPLSWYAVNSWLKNFAFQISLGWDLFVIPIVILVVIALGTVSLHVFRGANTNPAKTLRSE